VLIDWFTVGAQVLNFLVLVWLLQHFLYKPILNAIDAREKLIAGKLDGADAKMTEANQARDDFRHKNEELDQRRAALISDMETETTAERRRLLEEAREQADAFSAKRQASSKDEAQKLNLAIGQRVQQHVFAVARRALKDLSTTTLEQSVVDIFLRQVRELDETGKQQLVEALTTASEPATLRSAFALSDGQRTALQQALNETLSSDIRITFAESPDLISGIEFTTNGQRISWSIADYLTSLEDSVDELVKKPATQPRPDTPVEPPHHDEPGKKNRQAEPPVVDPSGGAVTEKSPSKPNLAAKSREVNPADEAHAHES